MVCMVRLHGEEPRPVVYIPLLQGQDCFGVDGGDVGGVGLELRRVVVRMDGGMWYVLDGQHRFPVVKWSIGRNGGSK